MIEALVVVAVMGLLAAGLTPVFLSSREKARQTVCAGNLGQLYKAVAQYAQDNDGFRPMYAVGAVSIQIDGREVVWPDQSAELVWSLQPYTRSSEIWFCLDDPLRGKIGIFKRHPATSYSCQTAFTTHPSGPPTPLPFQPTERSASRTPLFEDDTKPDLSVPSPGQPLYSHNHGFNAVFLDGHIRTIRSLSADSLPPMAGH